MKTWEKEKMSVTISFPFPTTISILQNVDIHVLYLNVFNTAIWKKKFHFKPVLILAVW